MVSLAFLYGSSRACSALHESLFLLQLSDADVPSGSALPNPPFPFYLYIAFFPWLPPAPAAESGSTGTKPKHEAKLSSAELMSLNRCCCAAHPALCVAPHLNECSWMCETLHLAHRLDRQGARDTAVQRQGRGETRYALLRSAVENRHRPPFLALIPKSVRVLLESQDLVAQLLQNSYLKFCICFLNTVNTHIPPGTYMYTGHWGKLQSIVKLTGLLRSTFR